MVKTKMASKRKSHSKSGKKGSKRKQYPGLKKASIRYRSIKTTYTSAIAKCWKATPHHRRSELKAKIVSFKKSKMACTKARSNFRAAQKVRGRQTKAFREKRRALLKKFVKAALNAYVKAKAVLSFAKIACYKRAVTSLHKRSSKKSLKKRSKKTTKKSSKKSLKRSSKRSSKKSTRHYADWEPLVEGDFASVDWKVVKAKKKRAKKAKGQKRRLVARKVCRRRLHRRF
jgi:hypothetical protein